MPYIGAGIQRFNTADNLTVSGTSELKNNVTVTGDVTASGTVLPTGDTAAGDAAAVGFTSTEGLILTGQGSTSDITVKNDADAVVFSVPTGTDDILFPDNAKAIFGAGSDLELSHNGTNSIIEGKTGDLILRTAGTESIFLQDAGGNNLAQFNDNSDVKLYHNANEKLATTSSGVDITGAFTATDGCTISTADNDAQLILKSTDADADAGPFIDLQRDSGSPADNDFIGKIRFAADDDAGNVTEFAQIHAQILDASNGSEDGTLQIRTTTGGSVGTPKVDFKDTETVFNEGANNVDFRVEGTSLANLLFVDAGSNHVQLGNAAVQYRSDTNGLHIGKDTEGASTVGTSITASGFMTICRNAATVMSVARNTDDGGLINFLQGGSLEGGISVSGTTVSYIGGHLSRWSQLADNTKDTSILKGTVMTNLDQMAEWTKDGVTEDNEQLNCMAVSSVEGDVNVAGVFVRWDEDDEDYTNDMVVAMTGDMVIRIAKNTTVARGNLLMSAGDGTAKPQGDGYVQDKTIAKVTSTTKSHTYDDGSYLVPCVLMAC